MARLQKIQPKVQQEAVAVASFVVVGLLLWVCVSVLLAVCVSLGFFRIHFEIIEEFCHLGSIWFAQGGRAPINHRRVSFANVH